MHLSHFSYELLVYGSQYHKTGNDLGGAQGYVSDPTALQEAKPFCAHCLQLWLVRQKGHAAGTTMLQKSILQIKFIEDSSIVVIKLLLLYEKRNPHAVQKNPQLFIAKK